MQLYLLFCLAFSNIFKLLKHSIKTIFILLSTLLASPGFAQESSKLEQIISNVTLKDVVYQQSIQEKNGPCTISIKIVNTDKQREEEYEFNFSDLNEYKINLNASKRSLKVSCETKGGKKVIRIYENGKIKEYTNKFTFYASDMGNGKLLVEELKKLIKPCEEAIQKELSLTLRGSSNIDSAIEYLKTNTKKVSINDFVINQHFSVDESFKALCKFDVTIQKDDKNINYLFNATDISFSTIDFDTKNEFVIVTGQTKGNRKIIEVIENGEKVNFTNKFLVYIEDIEDARKFKNVFKLYAKESEKFLSQEIEKLDQINSLVAFNEFFTSKFNDVNVGEKSFKQSFLFDSSKPFITTFNVQNINKGGSKSHMINLIDLNEHGVSFDTKGNEVRIEMQINDGMNLVKNTTEGESGKYTDNIIIWANNIEDARVLVETLKKMISKAKEMYKPYFIEGVKSPTKAQCLSYLKKAFNEVVVGDNAYKIKLEESESDGCKLIYEEHNVTKDKTSHYAFNMLDVNAHKINFSSKGLEALVYLETKGEKKYIEIFEQGTTKGFDYRLILKAQDIEKARLITEAFKQLTEYCTKK